MKTYLLSFVRVNEIFADYPVINIIKVNNPDFSDGLPVSSYEDLKYDSQTSLLLPSADLAGAGFVYDDTNAYILLKTSGDINRNLVYNYHLKLGWHYYCLENCIRILLHNPVRGRVSPWQLIRG